MLPPSLPRFSSPLLAEPFPLPEVVPRPPGTPSPATSQERSGLAAQEPSRRRRPLGGQRDKRKTRPGGFSINVFGGGSGQSGLPSSSYSISDGHLGSRGEGRRTGNLGQPWPNDKHWDSQHYESRELGQHGSYLY